jgi:hypothetical protein
MEAVAFGECKKPPCFWCETGDKKPTKNAIFGATKTDQTAFFENGLSRRQDLVGSEPELQI